MKKTLTILLCLAFCTSWSQTKFSKETHQEKMQWFQDAKLGIFIHWGIYSVYGIDESWSFFNGQISHEDYLKQTKGFTAKKYNPKLWVNLIEKSGAKYSVITSKHHDGFALWNTKYGHLNAVESAASKRDVLTPFVKELRNQGLKVGLYYSLPDWSYKDYPNLTKIKKRYNRTDEPKRWKRFLKYYQGQVKELSDKYNPDLYWFDGDWEFSASEWEAPKVRDMLLSKNPNAIINSRLRDNGDYATPEQGVPLSRLDNPYWELCMTINNSWGYQKTDKTHKTTNQIIEIFTDVIGNGGNLLLDIGPKADGTLQEKQVEVLEELGKWISKHKETIYNTRAGISKKYFYGSSTLSKDKKTLYLFVKGDSNGEVTIRGLKNKINKVWVVGQGSKLSHKVVGGIVYIDLPKYVLDTQMTVLALTLDGEINLKKGKRGSYL